MTYKDIIENIIGNGGLDFSYIRHSARIDGVTMEDYLYDYIKGSYNCHGNTARAVVKYFL